MCCLDASVAKRIAKSDRIHSGKQLLIRIVAMLTRLVERFDPDSTQAKALVRFSRYGAQEAALEENRI